MYNPFREKLVELLDTFESTKDPKYVDQIKVVLESMVKHFDLEEHLEGIRRQIDKGMVNTGC